MLEGEQVGDANAPARTAPEVSSDIDGAKFAGVYPPNDFVGTDAKALGYRRRT